MDFDAKTGNYLKYGGLFLLTAKKSCSDLNSEELKKELLEKLEEV